LRPDRERCLATTLDVLVQQLRDAAQLLVVHPDFRFRRGVCHVCERDNEVIWFVRHRIYNID
jgi:hypothetical protein